MMWFVGNFIHVFWVCGLLNFLYMWVHSFSQILKIFGHYYFKYFLVPFLFSFRDSSDMYIWSLNIVSQFIDVLFIFSSLFHLRVSFRIVSIDISLNSLFFSETCNLVKSFWCNKMLRFYSWVQKPNTEFYI